MSSSEIRDEIVGARSDIAKCGIPESAIKVHSARPSSPAAPHRTAPQLPAHTPTHPHRPTQTPPTHTLAICLCPQAEQLHLCAQLASWHAVQQPCLPNKPHLCPSHLCPCRRLWLHTQGFRSPYLDTNKKVREVLAEEGFEYDR